MMLKEAELPYPSHYFHLRLFGYSAVLRTAGLRVGQFIDGIVVDVSSRVVGAPIAPNNLHDLHSRMRLENGSCLPLLFLPESDSSVVNERSKKFYQFPIGCGKYSESCHNTVLHLLYKHW